MYEGRLVRLRALEPDDAESLWRFINDTAVTAFLARRYPLSLAAEREWIATGGAPAFGPFNLAIETLADRRLIGACGFHSAEPENRRGEVGISIGDREAWGQGYGTDAMRVLCRIGFDEMNLHRIELSVYEGNDRAVRCYEKVGFVREGVAREAIFKGGRYLDELRMGLLRGDFVRE